MRRWGLWGHSRSGVWDVSPKGCAHNPKSWSTNPPQSVTTNLKSLTKPCVSLYFHNPTSGHRHLKIPSKPIGLLTGILELVVTPPKLVVIPSKLVVTLVVTPPKLVVTLVVTPTRIIGHISGRTYPD